MSTAQFKTEGVFTPDNLVAGDFPIMSRKVVVASGAELSRGDCVGQISASGKYALVSSGATDGSESPKAIVAHDVDASGGDAEAMVYISGEFNGNAVNVNDLDAAEARDALRPLGIYLVNAVPA